MKPTPPPPLDYAARPAPAPPTSRLGRFLARLSKPMPLAMYFVIMFILGLVAKLIIVAVFAIIDLLR
jgi:hypothetical protein